MDIISIARRPDLIHAAAKWFNEKWQIPIEAYVESMNAALTDANGVPTWYVILDRDRIIAGLGVIDNDFHKRPDLTPNLCALYVEREIPNARAGAAAARPCVPGAWRARLHRRVSYYRSYQPL